LKCIFNHISYLSDTCFGSCNCSHLQAELLRVICTIGMLVSYEISYYNWNMLLKDMIYDWKYASINYLIESWVGLYSRHFILLELQASTLTSDSIIKCCIFLTGKNWRCHPQHVYIYIYVCVCVCVWLIKVDFCKNFSNKLQLRNVTFILHKQVDNICS
jgi:hypothetical protein